MILPPRPARCVALAVLAVVCMCLAGCGSKITRANFDKIKTGMSRNDVEAILGSPTETFGNKKTTTAIWQDEENGVTVIFRDDKVALHDLWNIKQLKKKLKQLEPVDKP
jgi:outer membrane protein assembly factor BamE (lipoprotein component of BamABCDE complex)